MQHVDRPPPPTETLMHSSLRSNDLRYSLSGRFMKSNRSTCSHCQWYVSVFVKLWSFPQGSGSRSQAAGWVSVCWVLWLPQGNESSGLLIIDGVFATLLVRLPWLRFPGFLHRPPSCFRIRKCGNTDGISCSWLTLTDASVWVCCHVSVCDWLSVCCLLWTAVIVPDWRGSSKGRKLQYLKGLQKMRTTAAYQTLNLWTPLSDLDRTHGASSNIATDARLGVESPWWNSWSVAAELLT